MPFSAATDRCKSACFEHFSKFPCPKTCGNFGVLIPLLLEEHSLFFPSRLKNIPLPAAVQPVRERDLSQCSFLNKAEFSPPLSYECNRVSIFHIFTIFIQHEIIFLLPPVPLTGSKSSFSCSV